MRYSELAEKEMVNVFDGRRLGVLGNYDLLVDEQSGRIISLVQEKRSFFGARGNEELIIPWSTIKRIGDDVVIVDTARQREH